jgi:UDP-N-acetylbacillosamine N-acetyltransferase
VLESKKVYLFGYSGHSYVLIESFLKAGFTVVGYFDYQEVPCNPYQIPYLGFEDHVDVKSIVKDDFVFPSIGDNVIRAKLVSFFERHNLQQCVLIDPSANVSPTAKVLVSTYIGKNVVINAKSYIGKGVIVNTAAIIEHECLVNDFCHIAPSAVLCGNVSLGELTFIGANSSVRNNISINAGVILGAGSVVVKSIDSNGVWVGNPLKKIK